MVEERRILRNYLEVRLNYLSYKNGLYGFCNGLRMDLLFLLDLLDNIETHFLDPTNNINYNRAKK